MSIDGYNELVLLGHYRFSLIVLRLGLDCWYVNTFICSNEHMEHIFMYSLGLIVGAYGAYIHV